VQWTKDNAQIFTNLFHSPHLGDTTHTIQEGKGQEQVSTLGGKEVVSLVKMFGVGHAWPAGSDDTSFGGGNFIHKVGLNYPAYVTQWFFENNRRLSARPGVSKVSIDIQLRDTRNRIERQGKPAPTRHD
jgi:poly(3-hydroxybutyrate) depolymerase